MSLNSSSIPLKAKDQSLDHPTVPVSAIIQSKSGGEQCQLQEYEPFSFLRSEGLKEKDSNDIMLEFRGYKMIDEGLPYVVNTYEGRLLEQPIWRQCASFCLGLHLSADYHEVCSERR